MWKYVAVIMLAATSVSAHNFDCGDRELIVEQLVNKHNEQVVDSGLTPAGVAEMWANTETDTWTFTHTNPNGVMCVIASGGYYTSVKPEPLGEPT